MIAAGYAQICGGVLGVLVGLAMIIFRRAFSREIERQNRKHFTTGPISRDPGNITPGYMVVFGVVFIGVGIFLFCRGVSFVVA